MVLTYTQLLNETIKIYLTGDYEKAYSYITKYSNAVNGNVAQIYNFRYAIASKAGMKDLALSLMKEAILEHGFWYAKEYLESDEDLELLRDDSKFDELVSICNQREKEAQRTCQGEMELLTREKLVETENPQLIIVLHGNQENNKTSKSYWKDNLNQKRMIALIQSSEIEFSNAYHWNDLAQGKKTIEIFEKTLLNRISNNDEKTIFAGFSAGARQVLHYALFADTVIKGLILLAPWLPELKSWEDKLSVLRNKGVNVYIVCGDEDEDAFEDSKRLDQLLEKNQIKHHLNIIGNLDHDYPSNFSEVIEEGIKFIGF